MNGSIRQLHFFISSPPYSSFLLVVSSLQILLQLALISLSLSAQRKVSMHFVFNVAALVSYILNVSCLSSLAQLATLCFSFLFTQQKHLHICWYPFLSSHFPEYFTYICIFFSCYYLITGICVCDQKWDYQSNCLVGAFWFLQILGFCWRLAMYSLLDSAVSW